MSLWLVQDSAYDCLEQGEQFQDTSSVYIQHPNVEEVLLYQNLQQWRR
jgi:hypothetical protein